jgi:hypothetical protein
MSILKTNLDSENAAHRVFPVTVKLTQSERTGITAYARTQGVARGEWMRGVVLAALERVTSPDAGNALLQEIVGVQLLLMNVLKPLATGQPLTAAAFDNIVAEVHKLKKTVARKLTQEDK